jgi:tryptophan-rich hypothetical protein
MNSVNPKKLLLSKWTAVVPQSKEKHFLVARVILPDSPELPQAHTAKVEWVELEAVHSGQSQRIGWRDLKDSAQWRQGWV